MAESLTLIYKTNHGTSEIVLVEDEISFDYFTVTAIGFNRIIAIKNIRYYTNCGLQKAKEKIDNIEAGGTEIFFKDSCRMYRTNKPLTSREFRGFARDLAAVGCVVKTPVKTGAHLKQARELLVEYLTILDSLEAWNAGNPK